MPSLWKVYLAECADKTYYCGITTNIERRLAQHNGLLKGGAKYTRCRRPIQLVDWLSANNRGHAQALEALIKKQLRNNKLRFFMSLKNAWN